MKGKHLDQQLPDVEHGARCLAFVMHFVNKLSGGPGAPGRDLRQSSTKPLRPEAARTLRSVFQPGQSVFFLNPAPPCLLVCPYLSCSKSTDLIRLYRLFWHSEQLAN